MIMTPWEDLFFVINNLLLGEEPVSKEISLTSRHRRMPVSEMIFSEPTCRFDEKRKNRYFLFSFNQDFEACCKEIHAHNVGVTKM